MINVYPTLEEFYRNPAGTGVTSMSIGTLKDSYRRRYEYMISKGKRFNCTVYKEHDNSFYYHIIVPSELNLNNYDVVVHLFTIDGGNNMKKWNVQLFSNSPAFTFTYAYVYNDNGLLIPWLKNKFNKETFSELPTERNPDILISYDKSIFFALHHLMVSLSMTQRFLMNKKGVPFDIKHIQDIVRTADTTIAEANDPANKVKTVTVIKVKELERESLTDKVKKLAGKDTNTNRGTVVKKSRKTSSNKIKPKAKITAKSKIR